MNLLLPDAVPFLFDWAALYVLASFVLFTVLQLFFQRTVARAADCGVRHGIPSHVTASILVVLCLPGILTHFALSAPVNPIYP